MIPTWIIHGTILAIAALIVNFSPELKRRQIDFELAGGFSGFVGSLALEALIGSAYAFVMIYLIAFLWLAGCHFYHA